MLHKARFFIAGDIFEIVFLTIKSNKDEKILRLVLNVAVSKVLVRKRSESNMSSSFAAIYRKQKNVSLMWPASFHQTSQNVN